MCIVANNNETIKKDVLFGSLRHFAIKVALKEFLFRFLEWRINLLG